MSPFAWLRPGERQFPFQPINTSRLPCSAQLPSVRLADDRGLESSSFQTALAPHMPIHAAARSDSSGPSLTQTGSQRSRPRHQLESQPGLDHGKAARRKVQSLSEVAFNALTVSGSQTLQTRLSLDDRRYVAQFVLSQAVQKVALKHDRLALQRRKTLRDQFGPPGVQCLTDLPPKPPTERGAGVFSTSRWSSQVYLHHVAVAGTGTNASATSSKNIDLIRSALASMALKASPGKRSTARHQSSRSMEGE